MPLSDHEKRLLDEIEQTLLLDDPTLASSLRSARPLARVQTFVLASIGLLLAGTGLLVAALRLHGVAVTLFGVAGFVLVVAGVDFGLRAVTRIRTDRRARPGGPGSPGNPGNRERRRGPRPRR
jgi:predicted exporter